MWIFTLSAFILGLNWIHDTDSWMHLAFGGLIWELKGLPENEVFSYPSAGMPFSYSSWLFGVTCYLIYSASGSLGLVLFKATTVTAAFYVLLRDSMRPWRNHVVAIAALTAAVLISRHRFVLRPDIFLMLFLSFSIFSLNAYLYDRKKYIYLLPISHLLWANSHSSINLMVVPFGAFIAGGLIQRYLIKKDLPMDTSPSNRQVATVAAVFVLSAAAALATPYSIEQFLYGSNVLSMDWSRQEILELRPPAGSDRLLIYAMDFLLLVSFALNRRRLSLIHLLLVLPFTVLPFVALRFMFLLAIMAAPIAARNVSAILEARDLGQILRGKAASVIAICLVVLSTALALMNAGPLPVKENRLGFGFDYSLMPGGAVRYMDANGIYGRAFNTMHFGQYLIWTGYPRRTVFYDARFYLPQGLLEMEKKAWNSNEVLDELHARFGFESVLLGYLAPSSGAEELSDVDLSFSHPGWALVYWDDVSLLYLRRGGPYAPLIERDEYRLIKPNVTFDYFTSNLGGEASRSGIAAELLRNINGTGSVRARVFLALLYDSGGRYEDALQSISEVRSFPPDLRYIAYVIEGRARCGLGDYAGGIKSYGKALGMGQSAAVLYETGLAYLNASDPARAAGHLERALGLKADMAEAYPPLITAYEALGKKDKALKAKGKYDALRSVSYAKEHFNRGIKAYFDKDYALAIEQYQQSIDIDPSIAAVHANLGWAYLDSGQDREAAESFQKAAGLDPAYAKAHYGLAFAYKRMGDSERALAQFRRFVELEPTGNLARNAKAEIARLSRGP